MPDEHLPSELIDVYMAYKYIGKGAFIMGVPARDLSEADLAEVLDREGITRAEIEASGLYVPAGQDEVKPFCGEPTAAGGRCSRKVSAWGERCHQHGGNYEL